MMTGSNLMTTVQDDAALPDEAVVIRGCGATGRFSRSRAWLNAHKRFKLSGFCGISVASRVAMSGLELAQRWNYTGESYRISTVGAIRSLGAYDVVVDSEDEDGVHALLVLEREPLEVYATDPMWDVVDSAFSQELIANPSYVS